jgi:hypothetical protein
MRSVLYFLVVALSTASSGMARDIFVSNTRGDDAATGEGLLAGSGGVGPVRSIARALRLAGHGDRIVLEKTDEPYRESISLVGGRHSGDPGHTFAIVGNGAILDGSAPVPPDAWEHHRDAVYRFRPSHAGHQQLFLDGRPAPRARAENPAAAPGELKEGQWCLYDGYVYFRVAPGKLPRDYAFSFTRQTVGITLAHVRDVAIGDLTVQGFQLDGINAANDARAIWLVRVVSRGNGRSGVTVGGASVVNLEDSLIGDNGQSQLLTLPWSETHVIKTELLGNSAPAWEDRGGKVIIDGKEVKGGLEKVAP